MARGIGDVSHAVIGAEAAVAPFLRGAILFACAAITATTCAAESRGPNTVAEAVSQQDTSAAARPSTSVSDTDSTPARHHGRGAVVRVALRNDLLTIHAHDAPLAEVLRAVHGLTGVSIEGVASASERVTLEVGPMRVKDAVIAVLDRSQCDYVLVSSVRLPERLERVVVSVRRTSDAAPRSTAMSEDDQRHLIDGRKSVASRTTSGIDRAKEQGRQERRFDRMFGACITQGCDAS